MAELLRMPEVLANSVEAILQGWAVAPGTAFASGQVIATVETEKAVVDVEAERDGVLLTSLVADGGTVAVGTPIAVIGAQGESVADIDALLRELGVAASEPAAAPVPAARPAPVAAPSAPPAPPARLFASPLARRLAREHGVRLEELTGTGPRGRIRRVDVDAAVAARSVPAPAPAPVPTGGFADEPHTRLRQAVARRLTESKQEVPHFYLDATCRVDRLVALRAEVNAVAETPVSVNDLMVKAAAVALRAVPELNVVWTPDAVRRLHDVDIAVAVAGPRGLVTPVLRGVDGLSVVELARQGRELRERAGDGTLRQAELEGGALSISNLGMFGTRSFTAIINPPQSAILAVGTIRDEPVVEDGAVVPAKVMSVTLSVDHRPVDGVVAARWLAAFVAAVESPMSLLLQAP